MRHPLVCPLLAILAGLVCARVAAPPAGLAACVPLLAVYGVVLLAFLGCHRLFLPLVLVDFALAAWLLAGDANRTILRPTLLDASGGGAGAAATPADPANASGVPVVLEGVLRQDASLGPSGVGLSVEVRRAGTIPVEGGVIATVSGELAVSRLDDWRAGRSVRMPALLRQPTTFLNPGLRDERLALARRGVHLFASVKSAALVDVVRRAGWWDERTADLRAFARRAVNRAVGRWSHQSAGIVVAILIGDRAGLSTDVERRLQEAGTYHVIAISGGNIAILAGFLLGLFRLFEVRVRTAACATIAALIAYADVVGGGASVVRATLMAVIYLGALAFDVRSAPVNALLAAAGAILCASPLALYDVAFALTFGATFGILVVGRAVGGRMPRSWWLRGPAALLLASASAELALLPVGACAFSRVTFAGLLLNFVAIPLMAVAQLVGMAVLPLAVIDDRAAALAGYVAHLGASGLVSSASLVDLMPVLTWRVPPPPGLIVGIYYAAFAAWFAAGRLRSARRPRAAVLLRSIAFALLVVSAVWILWSPVARLRGRRPTGLLRLTVIDVGQADALLVRFPDAQALLVDAGGSRGGGSFDIGGRVIAPVLWNHDVFTLDRLVVSHADPDHAGGAVALLRAFRVGELWEGVDVPRDLLLQQLHAEAAARRIPARQVRAGDRMSIGRTTVAIWNPPPPDWERQKIRNDDSVVMEIRFGDVSLLLTGDIGIDVERRLARRLRLARLSVMKVPHHGSTGSSSAALLGVVHPALAIFTVGPGALSAPGLQSVIARYESIGSEVLCTGDAGAVEVETDGHQVVATTFTGRRFVVGR